MNLLRPGLYGKLLSIRVLETQEYWRGKISPANLEPYIRWKAIISEWDIFVSAIPEYLRDVFDE